MKLNNKNLWHIIWVVGIYAILVAILLLIISYKVKWENKDLNTYLHFYNCSGDMCTTIENVSEYYGRFKCAKNKCPYIKEKYENYVILAGEKKEYVFDYMNDKTISEKYVKYHFANDNIIVKNSDNKYGVIDLEGEVLVDTVYDRIDDYKDGYLAYATNSMVGIVNTEKGIAVSPNYESVILIDDNKYAYLEEGKYYIASYDTELPINSNTYDYLYAVGDAIFVVKNKKIDILDAKSLNSNLLLKIDATYDYLTEKERGSLNLYREGNLLHFSVSGEGETANYVFDLKNKKLFY